MSIEIGTILVETYGWSALGNKFYKVASVSKTGKSITVERIGSNMVEHDGYGQNGTEVPDETKSYGIVTSGKHKLIDGKWVTDTKQKNFKVNDDGTFGSAYNRMRIWDGKPCAFYCD
jgi:hypothetical protein